MLYSLPPLVIPFPANRRILHVGNRALEPSEKKATPKLQTESISLDLYKALVNRCAAERLNQDIANGSAAHARILISKLFEVAKKEVLIVTGHLSEASDAGIPIYADDDVIANAQKFLRNSESRLSIIPQSGTIDSGEKNKFLFYLREDKRRLGTVTVYLPEPGLVEDASPHFMVSDGWAYRFETGADALPANESITAVANFGNPTAALTFVEMFKNLEYILETDDVLNRTITYKVGGVAV